MNTLEINEVLDGIQSNEVGEFVEYFFLELTQTPSLALKVIKRLRAQFQVLDICTQNKIKELELITHAQLNLVGVV